MGNGKSQSAITYMNEHPEKKFIYITPYLDEAARIKHACQDLHFIEPSNRIQAYGFKKSAHTAALIKNGKNIATTHQAFKGYTKEMLEDVRRWGYTLIVDENVDVLESLPMHEADIQMLVDDGYVQCENGVYTIAEKPYPGSLYKDVFYMLRSRELVRVAGDDAPALYYWILPPDLFTAFEDVFILTYLFSGQSIHHFLEIYGIPYRFIGIEKTHEGNGYRFTENLPGYTPEYVSHLGEMIHILDNSSLNRIGNRYNSLSMKWHKTSGKVNELKNNIYNCINNIWRGIPANRKMWGTFVDQFNKLKGKGYTKSFLPFNMRATNDYRTCDHLVYPPNIFMNVGESMFYVTHGIEVDNDMYALSIMVQWIWRSAIRDGKPIYIYIPSKRMRTLLQKWIEDTSRTYVACE